jgi:hypothetical protein
MMRACESRVAIAAAVRRASVGLALVGAVAGGGATVWAHDLIPGQTREEPNTTFEALTADTCSPCVKDSYLVATAPLASLRSGAFGPTVANMMARGGEIRIEVVRAYPLGKPSQQVLAMRATLSIKTGDGQILPVTNGLLDEEDVGVFAAAVGAMAKTAARRPAEEPIPDVTEMEFHAGSLRVGTMRVRTEEVAYLQAGNMRVLRAPTPFETSSAIFLPVSELSALHHAIGQAEAKIKKLRGH